MKAKVTYCESTGKKLLVRLAMDMGSANFEIPIEDVSGDKPEVGDEVELMIRAIPRPVPVEEQPPQEPVDLGVLEPQVDVDPLADPIV